MALGWALTLVGVAQLVEHLSCTEDEAQVRPLPPALRCSSMAEQPAVNRLMGVRAPPSQPGPELFSLAMHFPRNRRASQAGSTPAPRTVAEGNMVRRQDVALVQAGSTPASHPNRLCLDVPRTPNHENFTRAGGLGQVVRSVSYADEQGSSPWPATALVALAYPEDQHSVCV